MTRLSLVEQIGQLGDAVTSAPGGLYGAFAGLALLVGAGASLVAAVRGSKAAKQATGANNAVNNVGPEEPRLRDVVMQIAGKVDLIADQMTEQRAAMRDHLSHHHEGRPDAPAG